MHISYRERRLNRNKCRNNHQLSLLEGQNLDAVNRASYTYMHLKWNWADTAYLKNVFWGDDCSQGFTLECGSLTKLYKLNSIQCGKNYFEMHVETVAF